jgi:hypothetical protein
VVLAVAAEAAAAAQPEATGTEATAALTEAAPRAASPARAGPFVAGGVPVVPSRVPSHVPGVHGCPVCLVNRVVVAAPLAALVIVSGGIHNTQLLSE